MKHFTLPKDGGLIEENLPKGVLHSFEKINTEIYDDSAAACKVVAESVIESIQKFGAAHPDKNFRLGLGNGAAMVSLFNWLTRYYEEGKVSFKSVEVFVTDEYYPIVSASQTHTFRVRKFFLDKVDVPAENIHIPDGNLSPESVHRYCHKYDEMATGMELLIMGMGEHCQLSFNEAGTAQKTYTSTKLLSYNSRRRQSKNFNGNIADTPKMAITMGMSTIMSAKKIILLAWGEEKVDAVWKAAEGEMDSDYPATLLQTHGKVTIYADENSSSKLTRVVAPWKVGPCDWTAKLVRKAVVWLCQEVNKPILKLTQQDYMSHYLHELLSIHGPFDQINIKVFNDLQHTISGWPGGKPGADDSTRPVKSLPFPKTVLIFSPHPDDDVISMGGTFIRLVEQGHNVHVAYETSGDLAVHDDVVLQHIDAAVQLGYVGVEELEKVKKLTESKVPGEPEPKELLALKAAIRRSEARGADHSFGLDDRTHVHFLNLPFYESGGVTKFPRTQVDLDIIKALVKELHPHQIFMAGDLADPHGTHRVCTEAALEAIEQLLEEGEDWLNKTTIWLYRGAWMEWELERVDMAVPLSPDELIKKRHAIFRHLSQKDIVPFPGDDSREFWQRSEDRTQHTAMLYDKLGMAEYQAIEVFLKLK